MPRHPHNLLTALTAVLIGLVALACGPSRASDLDEVTAQVRARFPEVRQVSVEELERQLAGPQPPVLLDAREPAELEVSHLPGARLATDLPRALDALRGVERDQPIVVYCSVGHRSSKLAEELAAAGYTAVANLEGSIFAWANSGRPVYRGGEVVGQVHPYDSTWGRLLEPDLRAPID